MEYLTDFLWQTEAKLWSYACGMTKEGKQIVGTLNRIPKDPSVFLITDAFRVEHVVDHAREAIEEDYHRYISELNEQIS